MENSFKMAGYVVNPKKVTDNITVFALNFGENQGSKEAPVWKNTLVNIRGVKEAKDVVAGQQVQVEGFFTVNAYTPKGEDKEVTKIEFTATKMTVLQDAKK